MIKESMCFANFNDFYSRKKIIRTLYNSSSLYDKGIYKYYIYSRRYLREKVCDIIWEYLNASDDTELMICASNLGKEYSKYRL